jgi:hypothetical protein
VDVMFNHEADPRGGMKPSPRRGFYKSAGVLKFEYDFAGMKVATFEKAGGTLVRIDSPKVAQFGFMSPSERLAEVNRIGFAMFRISGARIQDACNTGEVVFQPRLPSSANEAFAFSTNPTRAPVDRPIWYYRIDAGVYKGSLLFLLYHRWSDRLGFGLPEYKWFLKEFREKHAPKRP